MKLYRGIKSNEITFRAPEEEQQYREKWLEILKKREKQEYSYPEELNKDIIELQKLNKLSYQHFTDHKEIAEYYVKKENGSLIEIDVPLEEIIEHFTLEFQNYSKRRERFEIVYIISSKVLLENKDKWGMKKIMDPS